jgi:hypothetical protein
MSIRTYITQATYLGPTAMSCESPVSNYTHDVFIEISISSNNYKFTQSNVTFHFVDCTPVKIDWLLLGILAAVLLPFLFFLCWFFYPWIIGARRKKEEPKTTAIPPPIVVATDPTPTTTPVAILPPTPNKKWANVDTSKYVWSREGGTARPMPVQWGELGVVASASHLEITSTKDEPVPNNPENNDTNSNNKTSTKQSKPRNQPGPCFRCWHRCTSFSFSSCYRRCADCRPHRGE